MAFRFGAKHGVWSWREVGDEGMLVIIKEGRKMGKTLVLKDSLDRTLVKVTCRNAFPDES